jgi:transposase
VRARRGRNFLARMRAAALEGCRERAREVFLPGLRKHHRAAGAHARARGTELLAMILLHQSLNRQSAAYAREVVEIDVSTLADWVGATVATLVRSFS